MLWPARMYGVDCIVYERFREPLIRRLHSAGIAQVDSVSDDFIQQKALKRAEANEDSKTFAELISKADEIVRVLSNYSTSQPGFVESTLDVDKTPRTSVKLMDASELADSSRDFLESRLREIKKRESSIGSFYSRKKEIEEKIKNYGLFTKLDCPLECFGLSNRLYNVLGQLPIEDSKLLFGKLTDEFGRFFFLEKFDECDGQDIMVLSVPAESAQKLNSILPLAHFRAFEVKEKGTVGELLARLTGELTQVGAAIADETKILQDMHITYYAKTLAVRESLSIQKQKHDISANFALTEKTVLIRLWVPAKNFAALEELVRAECGGLYVLDVDRNPTDAPVLLDNPKIFKPFELFTRMYSMPQYNQLDPTMLFAPTFILFFGLMFADAFYGILVLLGAYFLYKNYRVYSTALADLSLVLMWFGFSSIFFGLLTGSFLGDFLGKYLLGRPDGSQAIALWMDPMYGSNIMLFIEFALIVGLLHTMLGYFFGTVDALKRKEYKNAVLNYSTMLLFPIGLAAYFVLNTRAGLVLAGVSLLLLFIGSGLMRFYIKVSGMLGSVVSYARLLALMVSSAGIAMTVNFLASLSLSIPHVGIIIAPLVFIAGHVINLALNMLGSFVHSLRLHYVEFFGTFYEGGGVEFTPFAESRKYSIVQKEVE